MALVPAPAFDLARRIDLRGPMSSSWFVVQRNETANDNFIEDLKAEAKAWWNTDLRTIDAARQNLAELCDSLRQPPNDGVLILGLEQWSDKALSGLDLSRSALARPGFVVLVLASRGIDRLFRQAPSLRSWIGGSQFLAAPDPGLMADEERQERLSQLSQHFGLSDSRVIQMAEAGALPSEPEFAEWLVLLGRGDLVR